MSNVVFQFPDFRQVNLASAIISHNKKASIPKGSKKESYRKTKEKIKQTREENKQHGELILKKRIEHNKKKHFDLYKEFFKRGGDEWFEALTSLDLDHERIYADIDYFIDILEVGTTLESLKNTDPGKGGKLLRKMERERVARLAGYRFYTPQYTHRYLMLYHGTSRWADLEKMKEKYIERDRLTNETGIKHHVDHIIPIIHSKVCGLNNEFNLRVVTARENIKKSNKYEP